MSEREKSSMNRSKVQVTFDCREPERLAEFYAVTLDYKVQDPPAGFSSWEDALKAWNVPEEDWHSASSIVDPDGRGPRIYFQQLDTPKPGKNRVHLDVNASGGMSVPLQQRKEQVRTKVEDLKHVGAREKREWEENGEYWVVMLDPEGNEFCVQ